MVAGTNSSFHSYMSSTRTVPGTEEELPISAHLQCITDWMPEQKAPLSASQPLGTFISFLPPWDTVASVRSGCLGFLDQVVLVPTYIDHHTRVQLVGESFSCQE